MNNNYYFDNLKKWITINNGFIFNDIIFIIMKQIIIL
jgi:hypothetical protein